MLKDKDLPFLILVIVTFGMVPGRYEIYNYRTGEVVGKACSQLHAIVKVGRVSRKMGIPADYRHRQ